MTETLRYSAVADEEARDRRLDRYIAERLGLLSRSQIKARALTAMVNGKAAKLSRLLVPGDRLELCWAPPETSELEAQDLPLTVIYEDERAIVIDKAQGMVVHPGAGNRVGTVANALLYRRLAKGLRGEGFRPGIVHRLDKDTSGVLIAAYDDAALAFLAGQFKDRQTRKTYIAIVRGNPAAERGRMDGAIARDPKDRKRFCVVQRGGKSATTLYRVVRRWPGYSLLLLRPKTGRTHQLRVHLKQLGCPILGDPIYGRKDCRFPAATLSLHAYKLAIALPDADQPSSFVAPLPERFKLLFRQLARLR